MIRAVLIHSEPESCRSLTIKLQAVSNDIEIVDTFYYPEKAIDGIRNIKPDVVFLDVEMPGMNGFQLLEKLETLDFEVIFVTASNEYMLHALHVSALDYLLEPVDIEELKNALTRLRKRMLMHASNGHTTKEQLEILGDTLNHQHTIRRIALATAQGIIFLKINEIIRVEAQSNYSGFFLINKQKIIVSKTLKEFEKALSPPYFFRVSRSCIVNTNFIVKYKHEDGGMLVLQDGSEVPVGPTRKDDLIKLLTNL